MPVTAATQLLWCWLSELPALVEERSESLPEFCRMVLSKCPPTCVKQALGSLLERVPVVLACCCMGGKLLLIRRTTDEGQDWIVVFTRSRAEDEPHLRSIAEHLGPDTDYDTVARLWWDLPPFSSDLVAEVLETWAIPADDETAEHLRTLAELYGPERQGEPDVYDMDHRVFHAIEGLVNTEKVLGVSIAYVHPTVPVVRWFHRAAPELRGPDAGSPMCDGSPIRGYCAADAAET